MQSVGRTRVPLCIGAVLVGACSSSGVCPTIDCQPEIELTYQTVINGAYSLSVALNGKSFTAECPMDAGVNLTVGIASCGGSGLTISGVDLGHGTNDAVSVSVSIDDATPVSVSATLENITNSRDCPVVCYVHQGTVAN
jgi:hypothetical protein